MKDFAQRFQNIAPSAMLQIFTKAMQTPNCINLGIGEPDFDTDESIIEMAAKAGKDGFTHYAPIPGFPDLRQAISDYWKKHGLESTMNNVMVTVGATQALYLLFQILLDEGDEIILTDPYFNPYSQQIEYVGGKINFVKIYEEKGFVPTAADLEAAITDKTKVVLLNYPNNPTGAMITKEQALELAEVIVKHDLILISDEVYEAFIYDGEHVCFATLPGMKDRTVTIGSFSKNYCMTGWRIGYAIAPEAFIPRLIIASIATSMSVNSIGQKAAVYAINNMDEKVQMMVDEFDKRIKYSVDRINSIDKISCMQVDASFYIFINIKETGLSCEEFCFKLLDEEGVAMIPGTSFGDNGEGFVRISCSLPIDKLEEAFCKLENFIKNNF